MIGISLIIILIAYLVINLFDLNIEKNTETGEYLLFYSIPFSKFVTRKYIKLF